MDGDPDWGRGPHRSVQPGEVPLPPAADRRHDRQLRHDAALEPGRARGTRVPLGRPQHEPAGGGAVVGARRRHDRGLGRSRLQRGGTAPTRGRCRACAASRTTSAQLQPPKYPLADRRRRWRPRRSRLQGRSAPVSRRRRARGPARSSRSRRSAPIVIAWTCGRRRPRPPTTRTAGPRLEVLDASARPTATWRCRSTVSGCAAPVPPQRIGADAGRSARTGRARGRRGSGAASICTTACKVGFVSDGRRRRARRDALRHEPAGQRQRRASVRHDDLRAESKRALLEYLKTR